MGRTAWETHSAHDAARVRGRPDASRVRLPPPKRRRRRAPPRCITETLQRLARVVSRTSTPPAPLNSRLVEEVLHGEDIRRPLGLKHSYPDEAVIKSLRLQARTPAAFGGAKELLVRVRLTAVGANVSLGDGPEASGQVLSLLLAVSGRRMALSDLEGAGVAVLAAAAQRAVLRSGRHSRWQRPPMTPKRSSANAY